MPGMTEQQGAELIQLMRTIADQGQVTAQSRQQEERQQKVKSATSQRAIKKAEADMAKSWNQIFKTHHGRLSKFSDQMGIQMSLVGKTFTEAMDQTNYDNLKKVPDYFKKQLDSVGNGIIREFGANIKTTEDIERLSEMFAGLGDVVDELTGDFGELSEDQLDRLKSAARQLGISHEQLATKIASGGADALQDALIETAEAAEGGKPLAHVSRASSALAIGFGKLKVVAAAVAAVFKEIAAPALRFGTELEALDAAMSGMSNEDFAAMQAQYRQSIAASGKSLDDFQQTVMDNSFGLTTYTGDLAQSVRLQAQAADQARLFGETSSSGIQSFMDAQMSSFKRFNKSLSMTSDQFLEMNEQLQNSATVNGQIYRLNEKQRAAYYKDLHNTYEKLRTDGLLHEQALKVVEALEGIKGKDPRERMKDAAKMRAVLGGMGMAEQGARAQQIMLKGSRASGDETRELADIMKTANATVGERLGAGLGSEMMTYAMIQKTGLEQYLGPQSDFADFNKQATLETGKLRDSADKLDKTMGWLIASIDSMGALIAGPIGAGLAMLTAAVVSLTAAVKTLAASKILSGDGPGLGSRMGGWGGKAARLAGRAGAIGAAGYGLYQAGQAITTGRSDVHDAMTSTHIGKIISDGMGEGIAHVAAAFGNDEAQEALDGKQKRATMAREARKQQRSQIGLEKMIAHLENVQKMHRENNDDKLANAMDGMIAAQKEQLEELKLIKTDVPAAVKSTAEAVKDQTDKQAEQHDEAMKKGSAKHNQLRWTLAG